MATMAVVNKPVRSGSLSSPFASKSARRFPIKLKMRIGLSSVCRISAWALSDRRTAPCHACFMHRGVTDMRHRAPRTSP